MLKNNNNSQSYIKVRANKNLNIYNSGGSTSSNGSNYLSTKDGQYYNNKNSSNSSRSSNSQMQEKNTKHNLSHFQMQEDDFNHLNRNIDFSSINLRELKNQNRSIHNNSVYSLDNKENISTNYSNGIKNKQMHNQTQEQQETFRKIVQNKDEKVILNQQQSVQNYMNTEVPSKQSSKQKQIQNQSQIKNIYQSIINSTSMNQANKKIKSQNQSQSQQRSSLDISQRNDIEIQKKRSESTYSNQSFDSNANQSICNLSSNSNINNSSFVTSQINNWIAKSQNQIFKIDNPKSFVQDSSCISISQFLNQNNQNPNQNFHILEQNSHTNSGVSKIQLSQPQNQILNNISNKINESQDQIISNRINAQNQKNNQQTQQQNLKQSNIIYDNQNTNKINIINNNQRNSQRTQINPDPSHNLHTFSSSQNSNNVDITQNNQFSISQDKIYSQSNQNVNNILENLTFIQKQNEVQQLKKDLRQSNNEVIQCKNKIKGLEQENRVMKSQLDQEKQHKQHLEEYIQKIKGLQFIIAQEKKISCRIVQENYQRNENVQLVLVNLANIIQIIQQKIEQPKSSYEKILQKIRDNLNPILLCLNPIIEDINSYNQLMFQQQQNQHESRYEPYVQQLNKQPSQKGKKILTIKGVQQYQAGVQRNNSNNKLQNNQQNKKRCISVEETTGIQKQKKQIFKQEQNLNTISRSHSSVNVKQLQNQNTIQQKEDNFEFLQQSSQHLLKQSSSSINLQMQSIQIPRSEFLISDQNDDEIEDIITKQLLNNNGNTVQQIQINQQLNQQQQKNSSIQNQRQRNEINNLKNSQNKNSKIDQLTCPQKQQASLNDCQRINTKESMDSFYQQCLLNNSLKISESSRSFATTNSAININQQIQQNNNIESQNIQIYNLNQQKTDKSSDNYGLQSGSIFNQIAQCYSSIGNNKQTSQPCGQFFDSQYSQIDNNLLQNNYGSNHNHLIPPTQEFTGCFSTQNQPYLGTFSQIPIEGARFHIDSNYQSGQSVQNSDQTNVDLIQGRKNTNRNQNNTFRMSNFNSNSSQYNQSQKLFSDTLKGLGETLKNLKSDENSNEYISEQSSQSSCSQQNKNTFRSTGDQNEQQLKQLLKLSQVQQQNIENEEMSQLSEKLNQIGTEKSNTQLEIENLKQKIMQRQSRRKLQSCHNTSVQQELSIISEKSQRDMSAPSKECKDDF